ncbi:hypothetical protein [Sulfurimonas sp.]|uniref:hypothetical protein n=1 Tax=Sulfurimonas sp. TaxID=2022749 RepID=UPI002AAF79F8|nr:hypothetical protein [Sulfurimonas sp.]
MKRVIKLITISEIIILATNFISFSFYMNVQIAFLSSLFIIIGSSFAYRRLVNTQVSSDMVEEKRDLLDEIEDPYELYDDKVNDEVREGALGYEPINNAPAEELDLKAIVKEERKKIKTLSIASMKQGLKGGASLFRLVPYLFLVLGFIALKNNELLDIAVYLPSLLFGIIVGSISSKEIFSKKLS